MLEQPINFHCTAIPTDLGPMSTVVVRFSIEQLRCQGKQWFWSYVSWFNTLTQHGFPLQDGNDHSDGLGIVVELSVGHLKLSERTVGRPTIINYQPSSNHWWSIIINHGSTIPIINPYQHESTYESFMIHFSSTRNNRFVSWTRFFRQVSEAHEQEGTGPDKMHIRHLQALGQLENDDPNANGQETHWDQTWEAG